MKRKTTLLPALLLSVVLAPAAIAKQTQSCMDNDCPMMQKMEQNLHLNSDQKSKIETLQKESREASDSIRTEMMDINKKIESLIQSEEMDASQLDKLLTKKLNLMKSMMKTRMMSSNKVYNMLDESQKKEYKKMMKQRQEKRMNQKWGNQE